MKMELVIGDEYKRKELHNYFGGQRQGGISTPKGYPYIFIFTNERGKNYGYEDGWGEDGFYYYTGEGQNGDMLFKSGNKAIRDHEELNKKVFLFEETKKTFTKLSTEITYVDYTFTQLPDKTGKNRKGIQFIFERVDSNTKPESEPKVIGSPSNSGRRPTVTERKGLVTSRVGQGYYRQGLIRKFNGECAVTKSDVEEILIASHIVPWSKSSDDERLDVDNGILLSPLYDALFDKHLISFTDEGQMLVSNNIEAQTNYLNIEKALKIKVTYGMKKYLKRHRDELRA
jgi:hypothetical protein